VTDKSAARLGVRVARSVAQALDYLDSASARRAAPSFLRRLTKLVGGE
jgi:hypothetical protein